MTSQKEKLTSSFLFLSLFSLVAILPPRQDIGSLQRIEPKIYIIYILRLLFLRIYTTASFLSFFFNSLNAQTVTKESNLKHSSCCDTLGASNGQFISSFDPFSYFRYKLETS